MNPPIRLLLLLTILACLQSQPTTHLNSATSRFKQQMTEIIQNIKTLSTPQGESLKQRLLIQIFTLYELLDKYKYKGVTLGEVQAAVRSILRTIKQIQQQTYEQQSAIRGYNNLAFGSDSSAHGRSNFVSGDNSYADGENNRLIGDNTFAVGKQSRIIGDNSFAIGNNMVVRGDNSMAFGARGVVNGNNRLAIGRYHIDLDHLDNDSDNFLTTFD